MQAANGEQDAQLSEAQRVAADTITETRQLQVRAAQQQSQLVQALELTAQQATQQQQMQTNIDGLQSSVGQLATTQSGQATRLDQISAVANDAKTNAATANAAVASEQTARTAADTALGQRIDTVQTTANGASAAVQVTSQALADTNGKLSAMWSAKVDVTSGGRRYLAGIGAGAENTPAGMQTQVYVMADRFAVLNTANGNVAVPFAVQNGQVFMEDAFIRNLSITSAKIAVANVDTLHLKDGAVTLSAYASSNGFVRWFSVGPFVPANGLDTFSTLTIPTRLGDDVVVEGHFRFNPLLYNTAAGSAVWVTPALYVDGVCVTDYSSATLDSFLSTQHIPLTLRARVAGTGGSRVLQLRIAWGFGNWNNPSDAKYEVRHCILSAFISRK
ncbi:hypothetical protein D3C76_897640 [compost metagenome]